MAGFSTPSRKETLEEEAKAAAARLREQLDRTTTHYFSERVSTSPGEDALMAIACGLDALVARLELMSAEIDAS